MKYTLHTQSLFILLYVILILFKSNLYSQMVVYNNIGVCSNFNLISNHETPFLLEAETSINSFIINIQDNNLNHLNSTNKKWEITAKLKDQIHWDQDIKVELRVTSVGSSEYYNHIDYIDHYKLLKNTKEWFMSGSGNVDNITLQLRIYTKSIEVQPKNYAIGISFIYGEL